MAYFLDNYPASEESAELELNEEQKKYCRIVYKLDDEGGACFTELWNPEAEYSDEYVIVPIQSTGFFVTELAPRGTLMNVESFANVIGSGQDPRINNKWWIELWIEKANGNNPAGGCSSDGAFYALSGGTETILGEIFLTTNGITRKCSAGCSGSIVGGHIIINAKEAAQVPQNGSVYIIPICNTHNIAFTPGHSWGEGFYMKLKGRTKALKLKGYLQNVADYLEEFKNEVRRE